MLTSASVPEKIGLKSNYKWYKIKNPGKNAGEKILLWKEVWFF
jgi:hypothetical protein